MRSISGELILQRTIHYRAVEWFGQPENLVELIRTTLHQHPTVNETAFSIGDQVCEVRHRAESPHEIRLHLSLHVPGAQKGVRPNVQHVVEGDLGASPPPAGTEFTERELAVVIRAQKVGYVAAGRTHGNTVARALAGLVELGHGEALGNRLMLAARADPEAIAQMLEQGVDRFELGLSLPHVNAAQIIDEQPLSLSETVGRAIINGLSARIHADHGDADIDELANMEVSLSINARRSAPAAEIEALTALATEAVEEDEEFMIRTKNKARFTREKLLLSSVFTQPGNAPVLNYILAWNQTTSFLDTIQ